MTSSANFTFSGIVRGNQCKQDSNGNKEEHNPWKTIRQGKQTHTTKKHEITKVTLTKKQK